jgi:hypothetical protein
VSYFLLTCYLTQREAVKFVKIFFAVKDMKAARQQLERLMQDESRNIALAALIHGRVGGLERKRMDGEQNAFGF